MIAQFPFPVKCLYVVKIQTASEDSAARIHITDLNELLKWGEKLLPTSAVDDV
jgi:hypothetical protein